MDGDTVEVEKEIACKSDLVKRLVDNYKVVDVIPLPQIKKATLLKIVDYWTHIHTNTPPEIEKPLRSNELSDVVNPWYAEFVNLE